MTRGRPEGSAFLSPPPQAGRRVGNIPDQRQNRRIPFLFETMVEAVDHDVVGIQRQHMVCVLGRDPCIGPGVATDVPDERPAARCQHTPHEVGLPSHVSVVVAVLPLVFGPGRAQGVPLQSLYGPTKTGEIVLDERGTEPGGAQIVLDIPVRVLVSRLGLRLQIDVRQHTGTEIVADREQRPAHLGCRPFESPPKPRMEGSCHSRLVYGSARIWAFGAVLFEMMVEQKAFDGSDVSETLVAVIKSEPDWTLLTSETRCRRVVTPNRDLIGFLNHISYNERREGHGLEPTTDYNGGRRWFQVYNVYRGPSLHYRRSIVNDSEFLQDFRQIFSGDAWQTAV